MTEYAVLIYEDETLWDTYTAERQKEVLDQYWAYSALVRDRSTGSEALHPTSTATTVRVRDGQVLTTDGPFIESKEALGGFYIVQAENLDEAIELAAKCPGAQTGAVEVRPVIDWSSMG